MTSALQAMLDRVLTDERAQREFLWNPFAFLNGCGADPQEVRDILFWLPLRLASAATQRRGAPALFHDRADAGRRLAEVLQPYRRDHPIVLALPRGGVVVGSQVTRGLGTSLDVVVARKLGAPSNPEFAFGAIARGGTRVWDDRAVRLLGLRDEEIAQIVESEQLELVRRERRYRGDRPPPVILDRTVILVDDGLSSGLTARAAIAALRSQQPRSIILAVPACPAVVIAAMRGLVDDFVCSEGPDELRPVADWYDHYPHVTDAEVNLLLEDARGGDAGRKTRDTEVEISLSDAALGGVLSVVPQARGIVLFAHGSGSGRHSPRNRYVAQRLQQAGFTTLLVDLLTPEEEAIDEQTRELRFDIDLLAERLLGVTEWLMRDPHTRHLRVGYYGASTGAAAALDAATRRPDAVVVVVSRGGRPDLAASRLADVHAPTLLIVGENDTDVLDLNRKSFELLTCEKRLEIVPGAGHLFEEPGALEQVAALSTEWFARLLGTSTLPQEISSQIHGRKKPG